MRSESHKPRSWHCKTIWRRIYGKQAKTQRPSKTNICATIISLTIIYSRLRRPKMHKCEVSSNNWNRDEMELQIKTTLLLTAKRLEMGCQRSKCRPTYNYKKESIPTNCRLKRLAHMKATTSTRPAVFARLTSQTQGYHHITTTNNTLLIVRPIRRTWCKITQTWMSLSCMVPTLTVENYRDKSSMLKLLEVSMHPCSRIASRVWGHLYPIQALILKIYTQCLLR